MKQENTRQKILSAALDLFSVQGYAGTSVAEIADAVGIRKATLYSHYAGKRDILDALIREQNEAYRAHSFLSRADWDDPAFTADKREMTAADILYTVTEHVRYLLHDGNIGKTRKLLTVEQFRAPELSAMLTRRNDTDVMRYFTGLVRFLVREGKLAGGDEEMIAAELCLPVSAWIALCDREPEREEEVMGWIARHIRQFFAAYGRAPAENFSGECPPVRGVADRFQHGKTHIENPTAPGAC